MYRYGTVDVDCILWRNSWRRHYAMNYVTIGNQLQNWPLLATEARRGSSARLVQDDYIRMTSHVRHAALHQGKLDCLFNWLSRLSTEKPSELYITCPFCQLPIIGGLPAHRASNGPGKVYPYLDTNLDETIMRLSGDIRRPLAGSTGFLCVSFIIIIRCSVETLDDKREKQNKCVQEIEKCDFKIEICSRYWNTYHQVCNIKRTFVGNKKVGHSDVIGTSTVSAAPTTSSFLTQHLASMDSAKSTARRDEKHVFKFGVFILEVWRIFSKNLPEILSVCVIAVEVPGKASIPNDVSRNIMSYYDGI